MRRTLKDYTSTLRRKEIKKVSDSNKYRSVLFTSIKDMLKKNPLGGYAGYNSSGFCSILPIDRRTEYIMDFSSLNKRTSLKLRNIASRSPSIKTIKYLRIYYSKFAYKNRKRAK